MCLRQIQLYFHLILFLILVKKVSGRSSDDTMKEYCRDNYPCNCTVSGPTLEDVTKVLCPVNLPYKCLPNGTCYNITSYCHPVHRTVVSCFPDDISMNKTALVEWCLKAEVNHFILPDQSCKYACPDKLGYILKTKVSGPTLEDVTKVLCPVNLPYKCLPNGTCYNITSYCHPVHRTVVSCFPDDISMNKRAFFEWCLKVEVNPALLPDQSCKYACPDKLGYILKIKGPSRSDAMKEYCRYNYPCNCIVSGQTLEDVTKSCCPFNLPYKCLQYGRCYNVTQYCELTSETPQSCFPDDISMNKKALVEWCLKVDANPALLLDQSCKYACPAEVGYTLKTKEVGQTVENVSSTMSPQTRQMTTAKNVIKSGNSTGQQWNQTPLLVTVSILLAASIIGNIILIVILAVLHCRNKNKSILSQPAGGAPVGQGGQQRPAEELEGHNMPPPRQRSAEGVNKRASQDPSTAIIGPRKTDTYVHQPLLQVTDNQSLDQSTGTQ